MTLIASVHLESGPHYEQHIRAERHQLVSDEPEVAGGHDAGPSPFQLVLGGLASCTSITLMMYAKRKNWDLGVVRIDLRLFHEEEKRRIERAITFDDRVSDEQITRLLEIADKTPVTKALKPGFVIETTAPR